MPRHHSFAAAVPAPMTHLALTVTSAVSLYLIYFSRAEGRVRGRCKRHP